MKFKYNNFNLNDYKDEIMKYKLPDDWHFNKNHSDLLDNIISPW